MNPKEVDDQARPNYLSVAIAAAEEAAALFGLDPMVVEGLREQPEGQPGAYVWMTGSERTLLMGVQCESLVQLGMALGDEGGGARETGIDGLGELLNVAAGVTKNEVAGGANTISLGLPVLATGPIAPRVWLSREAMGLRFGEIGLVVSIIEMNLSPEALARKEEEAKNLQLREELQLAQKLEAVGQLAAGVAHEINTPLQFVGDSIAFLREAFGDLSTLLTELDSMQARLAGDAATKTFADELDGFKEDADAEFLVESVPEALEAVEGGMERVSKVVRALKDVGSAGLMTRQPIDVNELLDSTLVVTGSHYEAIADVKRNLTDVPMVEADPGQLSQVFIQLIINAAEAIETVVDGDKQAARGVIQVSTSHEDGQVAIEILDTGCGVPDKIRDRIFDPFFTTKGVGKNMGQGLSTVRTIIVDGHSGRMEVDSEAGEGARFTLRLPVRSPSAGEIATA